MPGATITTLGAILKDFYLPPVVEQLNNEVLLLQRLESRGEDLFGNQAVIPVHKARSGGIGVAAESAALPAAGNQQYAKAVYDLKYLYGRVRVTGPSMAKTASEAGAFLKSLKSELDGIRTDLRKDVARQIWGSTAAINGVIAKTGVTTASASLLLQSDESLRKGHVHVGMVVDVATAGGNVVAGGAGLTVTDVDIPTKIVTLSGAVTSANGDQLLRSTGASVAGSPPPARAGEITGVTEIIADAAGATVGGINSGAAGSKYWDNLRMMNAGTPRAVSVSLMAQAFSNSRIAGSEISLMIGSFGLQRALFELLQPSQRFVNTQSFEGGFTALDWQGKPFVADIDAPFGKIHFVDERFIKIFSNRDWHFLDEDGDVLKWVTGVDAWEAVLARYMNVGPTRRNTQLVLGDLTDTTGA